MSECLTCNYNDDPEAAPGGRIMESRFWILEHVNEPIPIVGWLVLKTRRHTEGIVGLNKEESEELGQILEKIPKAIEKATDAEMVYMICMTELVRHLHIHFIPRSKSEEKKGPALFNIMDEVKEGRREAIPLDDCLEVIEKIRQSLK